MARGRLQTPRCIAVRSNLCVFPLRKHLLASNLQTVPEAGFTPPTQHNRPQPSAHSMLAARGEGKSRQRRDNVGWASRSPAGRGPQVQPKVPLQYMYCGLTNIMCIGQSLYGQTGRQRTRKSLFASE